MSPTDIRRTLAVTLAGLALATGSAPTAAAQQDLRSPDARDAAPRVVAGQDLRSPDARDAAAGATAAQDLRAPDTRDAAAGYRPALPVTASVDAPGSAGGFDWLSATLGAAGGAGGLLLLFALGGRRLSGPRGTSVRA